MFTTESGIIYNVSLSARNAASLRGHFLNSNPAGWDLRGNIASKAWDQVTLQELSDGALPPGKTNGANPGYFLEYASKIAGYVHGRGPATFTDAQFFGSTQAGRDATGRRQRASIRPGLSQPTAILCRVWRSISTRRARPDLVAGAVTSNRPQHRGGHTDDDDGSGCVCVVAGDDQRPSRRALWRRVEPVQVQGCSARWRCLPGGRERRSGDGNSYAGNALTDGKIDLWWDDALHANRYGSYLSALTLFGRTTGVDSRSLGAGEQAAIDLGINQADATTL